MSPTRTLAIACSILLAAPAVSCKSSSSPTGGSAGGAGAAGAGPAAPSADKRVVLEGVGLAAPESVLHDPAADVYLVANVNGEPDAADDNGFISRVTPDGKLAELKWIDGGKPEIKLDAPKGMAITGGVLWVADLTAVRKFDARTGAPMGQVEVPGAKFLNDVTAGEDGVVYVSDTGADAVHRIARDGKVTPLAQGKDLGAPNGLALVSGSVWVVTAGSGELYELTGKGEKRPGVKLPKGKLDGVVVKGDGELLISSWEGKAVYAGKPGGDFRPILGGIDGPADIGWDGKRDVLLVPNMTRNALVLLPL